MEGDFGHDFLCWQLLTCICHPEFHDKPVWRDLERLVKGQAASPASTLTIDAGSPIHLEGTLWFEK